MQRRMRPVGTAAELERRRRRAIGLLDGGHSLTTVAQRVGAAISAVWRWREAVRRHGPAGLAAKPVPGRPPKLTARQRQRLPRVLARGARAHGYPNDLWTTKRVAVVIAREFDVDYHPAHVSRLLAACGWSCQKPERRAVERDEAAIAYWKRYRWTAIKKKPGA
jgi:transposase